jgi:hypothetical protein
VTEPPLPPEVERLVREVAAGADEDELARIAAAYPRMRRLAAVVAEAPLDAREWTPRP